jgi:exopolyphosphatase/guanosine-5'-triphosphate,3'-diphosphate pyrophosphatase
LHDVSWRAHPDYRAEVCFENATRANLGGLKHSERVFLGMALLHRYRNKREGTSFGDLYDMIGERDQHQAEVLGKAMRFGAMLLMQKDAHIGDFDWRPKKKQLTLKLSENAVPLYGEVAEARLMSLAEALGAEITVTFPKI